jgi:ketosteroid isomerase-like protein
MRIAFVITLWLALSSVLNAQQPILQADANAAAVAEIKTLELKLADLIVQGNWDEYAKHLTADYAHTRDNGQLESKDDALSGLRDVKRKIIVMEMEPSTAAFHVYGDTAIANAEFTITVRDSGQVKSRRTRQTDVFVKRDGQWWLIAGQNSTIGK